MKLDTISDLLQQAEINFVVFDLGRRIIRVNPQLFMHFEQGETPYPCPFQQYAWLGLVGWPKDDKKEHFIWFVKLPLDELGLINPVARDELVQYLVKQIEQQIILETNEQDVQQQGALPHGFTPGEESMAVFHCKISHLLEQPVSKHYQHARDYLGGKQGYDQWAFLTIQGLADVTSRFNEDHNQALLVNALKKMPEVPFALVCRLLEHENINDEIADVILQRVKAEAENETNVNELVAGIRSVSFLQNNEKRQAFLARILQGFAANNIEILAAIAGRSWEDLKTPELGRLFLEALANNNQGQHGFDNLLVDLLALPGLREPLMLVLRAPYRTAELSAAMGHFFSRFSQ